MVKPNKSSARREPVSDIVRQKGIAARTERGIFNRYVRAVNGRAARKTAQRLLEIDDVLRKGTRLKRVAKFENGTRTGTVEKELPLLPSEIATLMAQKARLEAKSERPVAPQLRADFLEMLPGYASRNGFTYEILLAVGVPEDDLRCVGMTSGCASSKE